MATGGMGDVLTGVCAALLGARLTPNEAARLGAWLCGRAAEMAIFSGRRAKNRFCRATFSTISAPLSATFGSVGRLSFRPVKNIIVAGYPKSGCTWATRLLAELVGCPVAGFWNSDKDEIAIEGEERALELSLL